MKRNIQKILLSFFISVIIANMAIAGEAILKLSGFVNAIYGVRQQQDVFNRVITFPATTTCCYTETKASSRGLVTEAKFDVKLDFVADSGLKYGSFIRVNGEIGKTTSGKGGPSDKILVYLQHDGLGRLEFGAFPGAGAMFEMYQTQLIKGLYGIEGHWSTWVSENASIAFDATTLSQLVGMGFLDGGYMPSLAGYRFQLKPNLPSNYSKKHYADANKVTFYTQPTQNTTFGISFIPDFDHSGTIDVWPTKDSGAEDDDRPNARSTFRNIISGGIQYKPKLGPYQLTMHAVYETGKAKRYHGTDLVNGIRAYEVGLFANKGDYHFGGSYGNWGKTATYREAFANTKQGTMYWTLVWANNITKNLDYSLSFMHSKKAGGIEFPSGQLQYQFTSDTAASIQRSDIYSDGIYNKLDVLSFGIEYRVISGLMPYFEATYFKFDSPKETVNNRGVTLLSGVKLSF